MGAFAHAREAMRGRKLNYSNIFFYAILRKWMSERKRLKMNFQTGDKPILPRSRFPSDSTEVSGRGIREISSTASYSSATDNGEDCSMVDRERLRRRILTIGGNKLRRVKAIW